MENLKLKEELEENIRRLLADFSHQTDLIVMQVTAEPFNHEPKYSNYDYVVRTRVSL